jgi:type II secretory pathway predicted ATPase ExeA
MFEAFYNLSDNPFRLTPDPKFCFHHPSHDRAYAYLQYALRLGEGFIMVTGRPGIGKTTLVQVFMGELEHTEVVAARVASANAEATDLMRVVAYAYGLDVEGLDKATILVRLKRFFIEQTRSGKRVLLIIDEAQGLPYPALEELRLLADLQMGSRPLLQLFLVGQEKLRNLMQEPAMEQFQQRVIGVCHLEPLCLTDSRDYMEHRFRKADWKGDPELTGEAVLEIYQFSKGVPRHINKICTRLLLDGFMEKKHKLDRDDILEVANALREERLAPLGSEQAAATGTQGAGSVPELENGTLTVADLALRADPQQPPLSVAPVISVAVAKAEEVTATRYTKQTAENVEQAERPRVVKASPRLVSGRSGHSESPHRPRSRPLPAAARVQSGQRQRSERAKIPAWKSTPARQQTKWKRYFVNAISRVKDRVMEWGGQLDISGLGARLRHYRDELKLMFEKHPGIKGRSGMWVGVLAVAVLAAVLLPDSSEEEVASHHSVMLEDPPETASVTIAADEPWLLTERVEDHKEFEPAIPESFEDKEDKPVEPRVVARDDTVVSPPERNPALGMSEFDSGSVEQDDTEASRGDETATATTTSVAATVQDVPEEPAPAAAVTAPSVIVASAQAIADAADVVQPPEPSVVQGDAAMTEQAVVTDSKVEVEVAVVEVSSVPRPVSREDKIIELLSLAQRALRNDRLLIPADNNAYQYYKQVLKLEPGNSAALFGMDQIVERYVALGRKALDQQDKEKAKRYIARGSRVLPGDSRLIALQESMNAPEETEIQLEAPPVAESKPKEKTPLSWLKAIFGKGQTTDRKTTRTEFLLACRFLYISVVLLDDFVVATVFLHFFNRLVKRGCNLCVMGVFATNPDVDTSYR